MSEEGEVAGSERRSPPPDLPEARVREKSRVSIVWLIPVIAALVGAWLVYRALSERGPEVTITFRTAEGVEAGKTKVLYKDVEIGLVDSVTLADDLSRVEVKARMVAGAERYVTEKTRFWIVRARISAGQVSGLGTVFSGAYISLDPSTEGAPQRVFEGLETPPVVTQDEAGSTFTLRADTLGSIEIGAPVYFRWIKVGQLVSYELDESGASLMMKVFVQAPHDARINSETRFWNASGFDVSMGAQGIEIDTVSVVSLLIGGIAFETPPNLEGAKPVTADTVFRLHPNKRAATGPQFDVKRRYLLYFDQSVGGLAVGSPVEFRGIRIGEVQDVTLIYDPKTGQARIPVVIEIEPERIAVAGDVDANIDDRPERLVEQGVRAQLKTGNLLTGQLAISFDFYQDAPPATVKYGGRYPELPTVPSPVEKITSSVTRIVERIDQVPIEKIGKELAASLATLDKTLEELRGVSNQVNRELAPTLLATLEKAEGTLASTDALLDPDSTTGRELRRLILELSGAAKSLRLLAENLERNPEELLRGKSK